mgnify:FL=1
MKRLILLMALCLLLFLANLFFGSVHLPADVVASVLCGDSADATAAFIVVQHRLPMAVTAMLVGAALAVAGLLLQTTFHNPLAGPSVFGISGGASLGVAILMLGGVAHSVNPGDGMVVLYLAAFVGAMAVTLVLLAVSTVVSDNVVLLIVGLLFGYLVSAAITLLYAVANPDNLQQYVVWGMGDFSSVSLTQLRRLAMPVVTLLLVSLLLVKPLNALLLGDSYAANLGVNIRRVRNFILLVVGLLTAITTTYCGPVAFLGLAVPHVARLVMPTADFRWRLPSTMLVGAAVALLCSLLCTLPTNTILPLNAVTPMIGVPVIVWVIISKRR